MDINQLLAAVPLETLRAQLVGYAQGVQLKVTSWARGGTAQQLVELFARAEVVAYQVIEKLGKGIFLDTATDPGDSDGLPAEDGYLTALGVGTFGTARGAATFATGQFTLTNNSGQTISFGPEQLYFQHITSQKAYRNTLDTALYTGAGQTMQVPNGFVVTFPIKAVEPGTASNAAAGEIEMVTVFAGTTGTNDDAVLGQDRQEAEDYRNVCRAAAGRLSPDGARDAYEWLARNLNTDGTISLPNDGKIRINVNRVRTVVDNTQGVVRAWFASPAGEVDATEFATLDLAIRSVIVPNGVSTDLVNVSTSAVNITYTAKLVSGDADSVEEAVEDALGEWFPNIPISGYQFNSGTLSGKLLQDTIKLQIGRVDSRLYDVDVSIPNGDLTIGGAIALTLGTVSGTITTDT